MSHPFSIYVGDGTSWLSVSSTLWLRRNLFISSSRASLSVMGMVKRFICIFLKFSCFAGGLVLTQWLGGYLLAASLGQPPPQKHRPRLSFSSKNDGKLEGIHNAESAGRD